MFNGGKIVIMKSIKKFENKKIQGLNENVLKGGELQHTGEWGRWDSDLAWIRKDGTYAGDVNIHIGPNRPGTHF